MLNINPSLQPKALVFWLHGLGADCHDFGPIVNFLNLPNFEFILPNAPLRPITLNNGMTMRGWYDIESLDFKTIDLKGLEESRMMIEKLIHQSLGSKTNQPKIFMAGFSQGAALSLYINEFSNIQFDGIIALSGYLPKKNKLKIISCPIIAIHGQHDDIINKSIAKNSYQLLKDNGSFEFHDYPMGHEVIEDEINLIKKFLLENS